MNGLRPGMPSSEPAGSGGAGCAARGSRRVLRACDTALEGPASRWPTRRLTAPAPTATEPVIRNARRPGAGDAAEAGAGPAGTQDAPGSAAPVSTGPAVDAA